MRIQSESIFLDNLPLFKHIESSELSKDLDKLSSYSLMTYS